MSDYRISNGSSSLVNGTGVIAIPTNTNVINGIGTTFLTELHVGDLIIISSVVIGSVASVTTNVDATLTYAYATGTGNIAFQIDPLVLITSINADAVDPLGSYYRWALTMPTGDALERGLGRPYALWLWKNIGVNLRSGLLTYCVGKSARVYIRTLSDPSLGTFATYRAAMLWPDTDNAYTPDFQIEFRDLVAL